MTHAFIFLTVFSCLMLLPVAWRLSLSLWTSIFQIYTISVFGVYPSFALISTLSLAPKLAQYKRTLLQTPLLFFMGLMIIQAISLLWAKDIHLGLATILYEMPFLILYIIAFNVALDDPIKLVGFIKTYAILSLIPTLLIIIFSFNRNWDIPFLQTFFAKTFINPHSLANYLVDHWDLRWPGKPNGFFVNANVGGGYFAVCAFILWGVGSYCHSYWLRFVAFLHWITLFFTFSLAASVLAIVLPLMIITVYILRYKNHFLLKYLLAAFVITGVYVLYKNTVLLHFIHAKIKSRFIFWEVAKTFFHNNITFGLGFGGWELQYEKYRQVSPNILLWPSLPPHDTLIQLWTQSGIVAVIVGLLFMISILWYCLKALRVLTAKHENLLTLCVISGFLSVFLQGITENWGIIGEMHIQPILAAAFGLVMGLYYRKLQN